MQCLPASVVIDARPRSYRPAVVQLPIERSHGARTLPAQMFGADLDDLRLLHLAQIDERCEVLGLAVFTKHVGQDAFIAALIFLVGLHDDGTNVEVLRLSECADGPHFRERLESEFRDEAWKSQLVIRGGRLRVPRLPVVHVDVVRIVGRFLEVSTGRARRVRYGIGILCDSALKNVGEENYVILPDAFPSFCRNRLLEFLAVTPVEPSGFDFIISAPDYDAGMIAQTLDLVDDFLPDVLLKGGIARNHVAAEHELLPNHDSKFLTDVVKIVELIQTAPPFPNQIH